MNLSTATCLMTGSGLCDPYSAVAAACASLYGPLHGGGEFFIDRSVVRRTQLRWSRKSFADDHHFFSYSFRSRLFFPLTANEAVIRMLTKLAKQGGVKAVPEFLEKVKRKEEVLSGFGHRIYTTCQYQAQRRRIFQNLFVEFPKPSHWSNLESLFCLVSNYHSQLIHVHSSLGELQTRSSRWLASLNTWILPLLFTMQPWRTITSVSIDAGGWNEETIRIECFEILQEITDFALLNRKLLSSLTSAPHVFS